MAVSRINEAGLNVNQYGNRNLIINGGMQVAQRGTSALTSSASSDTFITDRFRISNYSDATFTGQQVADAPTDFEYSTKVTTTGTDTSLAAGQYQRFITAIEGYNMNHLMYGTSSAKTCTLTFHVKSSLTGAFYVFGFNSAANRSIVVGYTIDSANTWEKKTLTIAGDTTGTWLTTNGAGMYFGWSLGTGTTRQTTTTDAFQAGFYMAKSDQVNVAGTNSATWQITGVQLEVGDTATDFEHRSFADELIKCQRYYQKYAETGGSGSNAYLRYGIGQNQTTTVSEIFINSQTIMRADPTLIYTGTPANYSLYARGAVIACTGVAIEISGHSNNQLFVLTATVASGLVAGEAVAFMNNNSSTAFLDFNAEL